VAKYFKNGNLSPILWQAHKAGITKGDLCRTLGISLNTLKTWLNNPSIMQLKHLYVMAGMFGISIEELVYIIARNKPQIETKTCDHGKWYIESIRERNK
jgi:lambda repressor-like predicted transcriptional regulator